MPQLLILLVVVVAVGVLMWLSWISLQSLLQARILLQARRHAEDFSPGDRVALHGPPRIDRHLGGSWSGCLWYVCRHQVLRRTGKNRRWVTVDEEERAATFALETARGEVRVAGVPTEVQASKRNTEYGEPGCLGVFYTRGNTRTVSTWLEIPARVTVVGRLERQGEVWRLEKDGKVGLLLSPLEPARAARREVAKGVMGLLVVTAAIALGLWFYYQNGGPVG